MGGHKESDTTEQLTHITHNKYHVFELSLNHSPQPPVMKEWFSMKLIRGAKKAGDPDLDDPQSPPSPVLNFSNNEETGLAAINNTGS